MIHESWSIIPYKHFRMLALLVGTALVVGSTAVIGGTIAAIIAIKNKHEKEMRRIMNQREEALKKLRNKEEKDLHKQKELLQVFEIFKLEVEQARKIVEEAEYKDRNGRTIKGYDGES